MLKLLRFVQPTFSLDLFERERLRQIDDAKARAALKQQDKDRRREILARMAERNRELTAPQQDDLQDDELDCLDPEEEDARLGKRFKANLVADTPEDGPQKIYQVARPPVQDISSKRDEDEEPVGVEEDVVGFGVETHLQGNSSQNLTGSKQISKEINDKQKAMGY